MFPKSILCYGDSNTWGYVPCSNENYSLNRYNREQRWTGMLQKLLSEKFIIIEEGLNGRTTNIDYHVPPERNGKKYLAPCLYSHAPLDLVVLALGGNDFKSCFNRTAEEIRDGLCELIDITQISPYGENLKCPPKILIIPPPIPLSIAETFLDENGIPYLTNSISKSKKLLALYQELAAQKNCYFLDTSYIKPSNIDGVHYDEAGHAELAKIIYQQLRYIFNS